MAWESLGLGSDNRFYYRNGDQWASYGSEIPAGSDGVISDSEIPSSATRGTGTATMPEGSWPEVAGWTRTVDATTHRATYSRDGVTRTFEAGQQGSVHGDLATNVPPPVAAPGAGDPGSLPYVNPYASSSGEGTSPFGATLAARVPGANEAMVRDLIPRRTGESETAYQARIMGMSPTAVRDELATADASRWLTFYRDQGIPPDVAYRDLAARGVLAPGLTPPEAGSAGWPRTGAVRPWHPSGNEREALPHTGAGGDAHTTRDPVDIAASQGALGPRTGTPPPGTMRAAFAAPGMTGAAHRTDRIEAVRANTQRTLLTEGWLDHATRPTGGTPPGLGWTRDQAVAAMSNTEPPIMVNGRPNPNMSPSDMASRLYTRPDGAAYDPNNPTAGTPISPTYVPRGGGAARAVPASGNPPDYDPANPPGALAMGMIRHLTRMLPLGAASVPPVVAAPGGAVGAPGGSAPVAGPGAGSALPADAAALAGGDPAAAAAYNRGLAAWDATHPGGVGGTGTGTGTPPPVNPAVPGAVTVGGPTGGVATAGPVGATSGPPAPPAEMDRAVADLGRYGITDPQDIAAFRAAYGNASTETLRATVPPLGAGETPTAARSAEVRRGLVDGMVHRSGERFRGRFAPGDMDSATADAVTAQMYRDAGVNPDSDPPPSLAQVWGAHSTVDTRIDGLQPTSPATTLSRTDAAVAPLMASATTYYRDQAVTRLGDSFGRANPTYYRGTTAAGRGHRSTDANLYLIHNGVYDSPAGLRGIARTPRPAAGGTDPLDSGVSSFSTSLGTGTPPSTFRRNLEERHGRVSPTGVDTSGPGWTPALRQQFEVERWRRGNTVEDRVAGENMTREGWAHQTRERLAGERHAMGMAYLNQHFTEKNTQQQFLNNLTSQFANAGMQLMQSQIQMMNQLTLQQLQAMYQINANLIAQGTPKPFDIVMGMLQGGRR